MSLPFANVDATFERFLQELPADFRELAFEFKAFTRSRKIKTPEQLLQVVMNYCGIDLVLRETAGNFTLLEERISDTAIQKRLKACVPWVKALLGQMLGAAAAPLLEGHLRFVVGDGSTVQGPGAKGTEHRLHLAVDLVRLELIFAKVTDAHEGESLAHYPLRDGDVVVVDRGYNSARALIECADRGVAVVVRYNPHSLNLYDAAGAKIDWLAELQGTAETERCLPVRVQVEGEFIEGYLHGCRLPPAPAAEARRRVQAQARKKGRQAQARTLALAEWVLVLSTLPPAVLPTATVLALYRVRWQVELVIKRLKSIVDIDCLRARQGSALADLYLHGKLLYAWVLEKWARRRCGDGWNRLDGPRRATPWRVWKLLRQELATAISGVRHWNLDRWPACLAVMQERPRRRPLQTLPDRVNRLIAQCQALGMSNV
jgi:hypothetical protein